jgi:hypothetical protein
MRENRTSGSEGRAEEADRQVCDLPRPDTGDPADNTTVGEGRAPTSLMHDDGWEEPW